MKRATKILWVSVHCNFVFFFLERRDFFTKSIKLQVSRFKRSDPSEFLEWNREFEKSKQFEKPEQFE